MQVAHTCSFHKLTCKTPKLNLYVVVTLMYKVLCAQMCFEKKKPTTLTVLGMLFSCVVDYNSEYVCLGLPHTSSDLH